MKTLIIEKDDNEDLHFQVPDELAEKLVQNGILVKDDVDNLFLDSDKEYSSGDICEILIAIQGA